MAHIISFRSTFVYLASLPLLTGENKVSLALQYKASGCPMLQSGSPKEVTCTSVTPAQCFQQHLPYSISGAQLCCEPCAGDRIRREYLLLLATMFESFTDGKVTGASWIRSQKSSTGCSFFLVRSWVLNKSSPSILYSFFLWPPTSSFPHQ